MKERKNLLRKLVREEELSLDEAKTLGDTSKANFKLPFKYVMRGDKFFCSRNTNTPNMAPICSIKKSVVAKIGNYHTQKTKKIQSLEDEYRIHQQVYNMGVKIPKPFGLYNIYDVSNRKFKEAIVMEKIEGMTLSNYCSTFGHDSSACKEMKQHWETYTKELSPKLDLNDNSPSNVMIGKDQKVYLIDPESWGWHIHWEKYEKTSWFKKFLKFFDL